MPKCCTEIPSEELTSNVLEISMLHYSKTKGIELEYQRAVEGEI
jgi:hypothetical protein